MAPHPRYYWHIRGSTYDRQKVLEDLSTKLLTLSATNVVLSIVTVMLLAIYLRMGNSATCIDSIISNICLWLSWKYNNEKFKCCCKPCLKCLWCCERKCCSLNLVNVET